MCSMRRPATGWVVVVLLTAASGGCAAARGVGGGLAEGAVARVRADTTLHALTRELADSAGAALRIEFAAAVLNPARETWRGMRGDLKGDVDGMRQDVGVWVRSDLSAAVGQAVSHNADILDQRLAGAAGATSRALTVALAEALTGRLAGAGDTLVLGLLRTLAAGIDSELKPTIHSLMREVRDSLQLRIQDVDRTVAESRSLSGLRAALIGFGVVALIAALVVLVGHRRRQDKALEALIDAIDASGDEGVRTTVRAFAAEAGVHGWLSDRVASRRACRPGPEGPL